ncbi:uncharacterized protein FIBRA_01143 [Fibroporia radiculosa]|uniref:Phytocyanin domain-containing protein n=1 Tax=Fibroporia radiculosa TaxID=599839 RepID=J4H0X9_9APHY|nr:uncharacterized protein FIBRA_01143 [Fibroporia radiculosa]CCL99129.1 predicted protein [Fibroporia radiculosa]
MVAFTSLFGTAALFVGYASALPRPQWSSSPSSKEGAAVMSPAAMMSDSWDTMSAAPTATGYAMGSDSYGSWSSSADSWSSASAPMATADSTWGSSSDSWDTTYATETAAATATDTWYSSATATWMSSATYTAAPTMATMSYGSGSSNWGGSGYENCVQQCVASFGAPAPTMTAASTWSSSSGSDSLSYGSSSGSGTTHTVIVAPTQGVLRFVPFTVNASVGDRIMYMWNANNHTVTKGSELEICNETSEAPFATGEHDKGFTFMETVNNTDPVFFFCSTPTHCEKGMFGIINPPSVGNNANTSVASMMPAMMANSSTLSAMYAASNISSNSMAASWGNTMDMSSMPTWSQSLVAENIMYTRAFLAANPSVMKPDGSIDMSATNGSWTLPEDISQVLSSNTTSTTMSMGASSTSMSMSSTSAMTTKMPTSGARSTAASGALLGVAAIAATFLAL